MFICQSFSFKQSYSLLPSFSFYNLSISHSHLSPTFSHRFTLSLSLYIHIHIYNFSLILSPSFYPPILSLCVSPLPSLSLSHFHFRNIFCDFFLSLKLQYKFCFSQARNGSTSLSRKPSGRQTFGPQTFGRQAFGRQTFGRQTFGRQTFG
jgi:hypothetical protein